MRKNPPGRKAIPQTEQDEIARLAGTERLQVPEIARRVHRDTRTVRKYLARLDRAQALRDAQVHVFRTALEAHHQDLCGLAQRLKNLLVLSEQAFVPIPDPMAELAAERLLGGLEEHLHASALWRALASWTHAAGRWHTLTQALWAWYQQALATESGTLFAATPDGHGWRMGLKDVVGQTLLMEAKVGRTVWPPVPPSRAKEPNLGTWDIMMGGARVLRSETEDMRSALDAMDRVWEGLKARPDLGELRKVWSALVDAREKALLELDTLLLRRVAPGQCRFCPGVV